MGRTMEGKLQRYLAITQTLTITIAIVVTTTITQGRAMQRGQVLIPKEFAGCNFKDSWIAGQLAVEHVGGFTQAHWRETGQLQCVWKSFHFCSASDDAQ